MMLRRRDDKVVRVLTKLELTVNNYRDHLAKIIMKKIGIDLRQIPSKYIEDIELKHLSANGKVELFSTFVETEGEVKQKITMVQVKYSRSTEKAITKFKLINELYKTLNPETYMTTREKLEKFTAAFQIIKNKNLLHVHRNPYSQWVFNVNGKHISQGQKFINVIDDIIKHRHHKVTYKNK